MKHFNSFLLVFIVSCSSTRSALNEEFTIQKFKDRALCNCIAIGLDSNRTNSIIQKLIPYNPVASVLFDSVIIQNLKPVFHNIYTDSIMKIGKVTEAAQGKNVYGSCMKYYKSSDLHRLAKQEIKLVKNKKDLDEYISSKYPTW